MYCPKYGSENHESARFCSQCGANLQASASTGLKPNIAAFLCYIGLWITGLVFAIIEKKDEFVRFHAMQSIVVFGGITIASIIFRLIPILGWILNILLNIVTIILWIVLMIKAYQGERYKLPIAGDIAEDLLEKFS